MKSEEGPLSTEERKLPFPIFDTHMHLDPEAVMSRPRRKTNKIEAPPYGGDRG